MSLARSLYDDHVDGLKLTNQQLVNLLELRQEIQPGQAAMPRKSPSDNEREYRRVRIQGALWIPALIREPSGSIHKIKVYPVDISSKGMRFFTDRFMHQGTACNLTLHLADGETLQVAARAERCAHVQGRAHEVGVSFESTFDMGYLSPEVPATSVSPANAPESSKLELAVSEQLPLQESHAAADTVASAGTGVISPESRDATSGTIPVDRPVDQAGTSATEQLRLRLPGIGIELKLVADQLAKLHEYSAKLNELGTELHGESLTK